MDDSLKVFIHGGTRVWQNWYEFIRECIIFTADLLIYIVSLVLAGSVMPCHIKKPTVTYATVGCSNSVSSERMLYASFLLFLRRNPARPARPVPKRSMVAGSGISATCMSKLVRPAVSCTICAPIIIE